MIILVVKSFIFYCLSESKTSNARHHPPPQAIDVDESHRVGGRVHAVVGRRVAGYRRANLYVAAYFWSL